MADFSEVWDYRSGESRLKFHDEHGTGDPHVELTYRAARELGLMNPIPPTENEYDYLLILGGLATGVEPRVKYAKRLIDGGLKVKGQIAGLGSYRPLAERELEVSKRYAPDGRYEIDHLAAMMAALFADKWKPPSLEVEDPARVSTVWEMPTPDSDVVDLGAYAAASSRPGERPANTADTYDLFAAVTPIEPGSVALLITSAIYAPYQHLDAVREFEQYGITIETIGLQPTQPGHEHRHPPHAYRQEIRSTIRSALQMELRLGERPEVE